MRTLRAAIGVLACCIAGALRAAEADTAATVEKVTAAIGGEGKVLTLFRLRERLNVSSDPSKAGKERVSVIEPPSYWWVGKRERVKGEQEPAIFLVWAWTLGALRDPKSKIDPIPEITDDGAQLIGLRVSGTIEPAMDVYFDKATHRLTRIDWRTDTHRFSEWRELDGLNYPAKCVGYKKTGRAWYFSEITGIERLSELPAELKR